MTWRARAFCVAWRRFADVPSPSLPWLLGIARNVLRESFRVQAKQESLAAELATWTSSHESGTGDLVEERTSALRGLAALSDQDRELLTLVAWHGLSTDEAAKVVDCSRATYFVRLHRARKRSNGS